LVTATFEDPDGLLNLRVSVPDGVSVPADPADRMREIRPARAGEGLASRAAELTMAIATQYLVCPIDTSRVTGERPGRPVDLTDSEGGVQPNLSRPRARVRPGRIAQPGTRIPLRRGATLG
jgi:hypothetical protein